MEKEIEFAKRIGYKYVSITPSGKISGYGLCRKTLEYQQSDPVYTIKQAEAMNKKKRNENQN